MRRLAALLLLLAACEHSAPFQSGSYGPDGPLIPGPVVRLTYNPGQDLAPVWLLATNAIVYTAERMDRADHDRCLAFMPAAGGAIARYVCRTNVSDDSLNVFEEPGAGPAGRVAYVRASSTRRLSRVAPDAQELVSARNDDWTSPRFVLSLPFVTPWGQTYDAVAHLTWLDSTRLVLVGQRVRYPVPCRLCPRDTVRTGIEVALVTFVDSTPGVTLVPGTADASSISAGASPDTMYFTRVGDSRVYRYALSSGQTDAVYDFGGLGIARDLTVAGGKLAAIVGGEVTDSTDLFLGRIQTDYGGFLYVVTLGDGALAMLGDTASRYRRPTLAPDGSAVIVSGRDSVSTTADLWRFELP